MGGEGKGKGEGGGGDQHYFVRKCSESPRKVEIEKVRMEMRGNTAKYTVKRIILP